MMHDHPDIDVLHAGCSGCVERVKRDQEEARWAEAPLRSVTWRCSYDLPAGANHELSFVLEVAVPTGVDPWALDERYADLAGEAFVLALPSSVPMVDTDYAMESMEVESVTIGALVPDLPPVEPDGPSLFEALA